MTHPLHSLVLGLDGATWDLLLPLAERGVMPHLAARIASGARSVLHSTIPPLTGPAWTTLATGKNPGHHGFFDWGILSEDYRLHMWSARQVRDQPFWARLSDAGRCVGVFDFPFTYPPEPLNGFMVCGMGTPGRRFQWAYPPDWQPEIEQTLPPDYSFNFQLVAYAADEYDRLVDDLIAGEQVRTRVLLAALDRFNPDDLVVVFTGVDRVGHFLGHRADFSSADFDRLPPDQAAIVRYYRALDGHIGALLDRLAPGGLLAVVSDHGFTRLRSILHLNEWLLRRGYLATFPLSRLKASLAYVSGAFSRRRNQQIAGSVDDAETGISDELAAGLFDAGRHLGQRIDWSRTRAFSNSYNGIYLNTVGRFRQGTVRPGPDADRLSRQIAGDLLRLVDPQTGEPVVERVYRREEVYEGPRLEHTPDLIIDFRSDAWAADRFFFVPHDFGLRHGLSPFRRPSPWGRGNHHRSGILLLEGAPFRAGAALPGAHLQDVAPTLLYALGLPVPSGMTGRVIEEAFDPAFRDRQPIRIAPDLALKPEPDSGSGLSAREEELVYERLRDLGYME